MNELNSILSQTVSHQSFIKDIARMNSKDINNCIGPCKLLDYFLFVFHYLIDVNRE